MIVKCINDGLDHTTDWKIGQVDGTDNIVIDYEGKYCDEALKEIAEKVGGKAEWWIEGQTVNICRCEHGEELAIETPATQPSSTHVCSRLVAHEISTLRNMGIIV